MGLFDKINLLHIFMFTLLIIGLLLIITTFSAYSKLGDCTSKGLRSKLRLAIILGTVFFTISIGYIICIKKSGCFCDFGQRSDWKIYSMLITLMGMGGGMLVLAQGIKSDLKSNGCNIDIGKTPDILTWLSIVQIALPAMYIVYIFYKKRQGPTSPNDIETGVETKSDDYLALQAESSRVAINKRRSARYRKNIAQKSDKLTKVRDRIEIARDKNHNPKTYDLELEDMLEKEINSAKKSLSSIGLGSESSSTQDSGSGSGQG